MSQLIIRNPKLCLSWLFEIKGCVSVDFSKSKVMSQLSNVISQLIIRIQNYVSVDYSRVIQSYVTVDYPKSKIVSQLVIRGSFIFVRLAGKFKFTA
jgi:hypothetical protein